MVDRSSRWWKKLKNILCLFVLTQFTKVKDGRTDRHTDRHRMTAQAARRLCIASRGNKTRNYKCGMYRWIIASSSKQRKIQESQMSQRSRAIRRVVRCRPRSGFFLLSLKILLSRSIKVVQGHSKLHRWVKGVQKVIHCWPKCVYFVRYWHSVSNIGVTWNLG